MEQASAPSDLPPTPKAPTRAARRRSPYRLLFRRILRDLRRAGARGTERIAGATSASGAGLRHGATRVGSALVRTRSAMARIGRTASPALRGLGQIARRSRPWLRPLAGFAAVLIVAGFGFLAYCVATLPLDGGTAPDPSAGALVVEAADGEIFATRGSLKGDPVTAAEIPAYVARAIVAIEDRRFYEHSGIDLRGAVRAAWRNIRAGRTREGGSTITQQLVRMMFLSPERTIRRKTQEILLALWIERQLTKGEILARYLNSAYFGAGATGVDAAARRYFQKPAADLSLGEAAMLAGLVRAPSQLAPTRNPQAARERAELVLAAMVETGAITGQEAAAARAGPLALKAPPDTEPGVGWFVDSAAGEVKRLLGSSLADLTLRTTLDRRLQGIVERVVERRLAAEGPAKDVSQAAVVVLGHDGAVLAMVGGRNYEASQFNRVTQARRQPGSLFKLFVYLAAMERGIMPATTVVDRPVKIGDWEPENFGDKHRGAVTIRAAFAHSVNTVAAELAQNVGMDRVVATARRLGITSELAPVPSLALGSVEVTLLDITRAYAAVAANRPRVEPFFLRGIASRERSIYTRPPPHPAPAADAFPGRSAMVELLTEVVREGTAKSARLPGPAAGKTGTTQDHRDAWFVGFTPEFVIGVWVGNDDNRPMKGVTGGELPASIWKDIVVEAGTVAKPLPSAPAPRNAPAAPATPGGPADAEPPRIAAAIATAPAATPDPALRGAAQVIDTGTLTIDGTRVKLAGVDGEGGRTARRLGRFLRRREVVCEPAAPEVSRRCSVEGVDLSALVLLNGAGRATADAPPELLAAEDRARRERRGVWRRRN